MYARQNNEHDCLDYGYASLDGLGSPIQLSVGRLRNYVEKIDWWFNGVWMLSVWATQYIFIFLC